MLGNRLVDRPAGNYDRLLGLGKAVSGRQFIRVVVGFPGKAGRLKSLLESRPRIEADTAPILWAHEDSGGVRGGIIRLLPVASNAEA